MSPEVAVAVASLRLGFISALIHIVRWPDWQLPALFTRGFKVAGLIEPSNVYPMGGSSDAQVDSPRVVSLSQTRTYEQMREFG